MSRIGKKPVSVPANVKVAIDQSARTVSIDGPKGKLELTHCPEVAVTWDEGTRAISCTIPAEQQRSGQMRAHWGTVRSNIQNLVTGVTAGYQKKLEVIGVGWNAKLMGKSLQLNVGFCHPIDMPIPDGLDVKVERNVITVAGCCKQGVGQFSADVRSKRPPEPYNGKGVKYMDEIIIRKQGKAFGA